jgi:hypothetical protein
MPEAVPQQPEISGETPPFFRLRQADTSMVGDAIRQIKTNGMSDPESARRLLSLFHAVPDITEDKFHIFSNNTAETLWDQVAAAVIREKTLDADQKGALTALKYFALESLTEGDPSEPVREEAQEELRQYGAQLAKTLDPDDPASARFFDAADAVGKAAGKTARAAGTGYLILNLIGCVEPTITPNLTGAPKQTATETFIPTPTETLQVQYQADVVDITALYEKQPTADNPIKPAYDLWLAQTKEISNLSDPRIWTLQMKSNGALMESVVLAQSQYTHDAYVLNIVSGEGDFAQSTHVNSQLFAEAVMGKEGQYQHVDYYYKDQAGNNVSMLSYAGEQGKFVYTKLDGQKAEFEGLGIYFGKTEEPTTGGKLLSLVPPGEDFYKTLPEGSIINTETGQITDSSGGLFYRYESGKWLSTRLSENPTAQELFAAKQGEVQDAFTFGGHEWTAGTNAKGEKAWSREDGKITYEWASLYGGGRYNAYMFVTRSERVEGKRSIEIYADPRSYIFFHIEGSPDAIDGFVENTVANAMKSDAAQAVLKQPGSTLKIIVGGMEYWPIGGTNYFRPMDISYYGPDGETLWQKIWGDMNMGSIGPFVEPVGNAVQCAHFFSSELFDGYGEYAKEHPDEMNRQAAVLLYQAIGRCTDLDPESTTPGHGSTLPGELLIPLFVPELIERK